MGLRDRAIILCLARLGLRASEVAQLRLDDLDWRNATVRVRARKTGHGALLPLTDEVGAALADYLSHGRPVTQGREVFVLHWLRVGAPISDGIVRRAVTMRCGVLEWTRRSVGRTCCGIRWPRICSIVGRVCARSPICSGTHRCHHADLCRGRRRRLA